ncbi:hypothetical protein FSP39_011260 [Pinctada imbricata]|uniref:Plastocyanin-like domain-containing protein n=1 Tax=Pinctada imbricata TaxID=66713 RepID=A0AA88XLZ3_PINIB|nr:hypothetical protein FSP39_011260 [Pinctada imbricata]
MAHPIHLHGYTFHVLKVAYPSYEPGNGTVSKINPDILYSADFSSQQWRDSSWHDDSVPGLNLFDPPLKDTITIPKQGYVVIRFRADNPGFWFMHCHLEVHTQLGMGLVLQVGEPEDLPPVPIGFPLCGLINGKASHQRSSYSNAIHLHIFSNQFHLTLPSLNIKYF